MSSGEIPLSLLMLNNGNSTAEEHARFLLLYFRSGPSASCVALLLRHSLAARPGMMPVQVQQDPVKPCIFIFIFILIIYHIHSIESNLACIYLLEHKNHVVQGRHGTHECEILRVI
jgi:hypothetical protein